MGNRWETMETVRNFIFGAPKSLQMVTAAMKLKHASPTLPPPYPLPAPKQLPKYRTKII